MLLEEMAKQIVKYVDYFDITIDGPRKIHNGIRGCFDYCGYFWREGHAILIYPDLEMVTSPVWIKNGCIDVIGNINITNIEELWSKYP